MDIKHVPDDELARLAEKEGPTGAAATILDRLREKRAKDRQVFAWQAGNYYFTGPVPDALTECLIIQLLNPAEEDEDG